MSKIYEIHPGWMSKSEIAYKLGVSERTIYARWKRGELLRKEIQGQVLWAELPKEGRKEAEEGPSSASFHALPEGFGSRGSWSSVLEEQQTRLYELTNTLKQKQRAIAELEKQNAELQISLAESEKALALISQEKSRVCAQNELLLELLGRRTLFQSLLGWIKRLWSQNS